MSDEKAADDERFVCTACGKTSATKYGLEGTADAGWDESCMMNCEKFKKDQLVYKEGKLVKVRAYTQYEYATIIRCLTRELTGLNQGQGDWLRAPLPDYTQRAVDTLTALITRFEGDKKDE